MKTDKNNISFADASASDEFQRLSSAEAFHNWSYAKSQAKLYEAQREERLSAEPSLSVRDCLAEASAASHAANRETANIVSLLTGFAGANEGITDSNDDQTGGMVDLYNKPVSEWPDSATDDLMTRSSLALKSERREGGDKRPIIDEDVQQRAADVIAAAIKRDQHSAYAGIMRDAASGESLREGESGEQLKKLRQRYRDVYSKGTLMATLTQKVRAGFSAVKAIVGKSVQGVIGWSDPASAPDGTTSKWQAGDLSKWAAKVEREQQQRRLKRRERDAAERARSAKKQAKKQNAGTVTAGDLSAKALNKIAHGAKIISKKDNGLDL
ncbi:hypothetical protein [uncultured Lacticaseibacillus sp.]|uniref:hypothetical protein n=1 Tax=uncultured Lacticaseibacillus sp. TaxID=2775882 RepID=UPI002593A29B|nr:hypothetical protein [uncultured Lacticaseibacillus sp.]